MRFLGLDGFRNGWVAVWIDGDQRGIAFPANIQDALKIPYDLAMIDIPIGLPDRGNRVCDVEARNLLGAARSRVFLGARRSLSRYSTQAEANAWAKSVYDSGVSCQLFCISKKIDEVDAVMTPELQKSVLETHPELVFCRLNGSKPLTTGKKKQGGVQQRRALLMSEGFVELDNWLNARAPKVARDDVLDACACAIAARDRKRRIPECPETDSNGLRMEMWF